MPSENESKEFIITRTFNASRERVWKAFSTAEALGQWWGPKGFDIVVKKFEFKPKGIFHYCMVSGEHTMWGRFEYVELVEPEKIVFINSFSDELGGVVRAPFFDGKWPLEIRDTLTLEEKDGVTTITLRGEPINATVEEMAAFESNKPSMNQGFEGTWQKLDDYLVKGEN